MQVLNPLSQSRLCLSLGLNLHPFEVRDVPDGFEQCADCRCVLEGEAKAAKTTVKGDE